MCTHTPILSSTGMLSGMLTLSPYCAGGRVFRVDRQSGAGTGLSSRGASGPAGGTSFGAGSVSLCGSTGAVVSISRGVACISSLLWISE